MKSYWIHPSRIFPGNKAFKLQDTHGLPLEYIAILTYEKGMIVDWEEFIKEAIKSKNYLESKIPQLIQRIKNACKDAGYNDEWWEKQIKENPLLFKKNEN